MDVDVHTAKTELSKLIRRAEAGEDVFITRRGLRVVRLSATNEQKLQFGTLAGTVPEIDDRLLFSMSDEEADAFIEGNW